MENNVELNKILKKKLTREELLAGKCQVDENDETTKDPRFKSPDEILLQMVSQKRTNGAAEVTIQHGYRRGETTIGAESISRLPSAEILNRDLEELREQHEKDKERWKEYEQRILQWKSQVMTVIQNLQDQANDNETLQKEVETLKELNRKKDEEIESLADEIKKLANKKK